MRFSRGKFVWFLCAAGAFLACLVFLPATQQAQQTAPPPPMVGPPARIAAQAIFNSRCATVNSVPAKGGSLGAPGPVVAGGVLYVGSGYVGTGNGIPGNVPRLLGAVKVGLQPWGWHRLASSPAALLAHTPECGSLLPPQCGGACPTVNREYIYSRG